jgi:hypothetical protein
VSFQRDGQYLYGATREGIYRVPLGTTEIEVVWRNAKDGPAAPPGALQYGRYLKTAHGVSRPRYEIKVVDSPCESSKLLTP